jgi:hypothetical protein
VESPASSRRQTAHTSPGKFVSIRKHVALEKAGGSVS